MGFVNAQTSRVAVGLLNASGYARGFEVSAATDTLDTTTLVDTAKVFIIGQDTSTGSIDMLFDTVGTTGLQYATLTAQKATGPYALTLCPDGFGSGALAVMVSAHLGSFSGAAANADVVSCQAQFQDTGVFDVGAVVENFAAVTTTTTGSARDFTASSSNGGVAHLHVSAFSGLTSNTVRIEHSADGSTGWATLATFTAATGATSQRLEVAAGSTINRYLRVVDTVVGTGTCTRFVAFARR